MLVAFDFDGTLSSDEMTTFLAEQCGVTERMDEITQRAMRGEIEYAESLRERCGLLEGLDDDRAQADRESASASQERDCRSRAHATALPQRRDGCVKNEERLDTQRAGHADGDGGF